MARVTWTSTITPTLLNNFAAGYNRFLNQNGAPLDHLNQDWAGQIGIQNTSATAFPAFRFSGADYQGGTIGRHRRRLVFTRARTEAGYSGMTSRRSGASTRSISATNMLGTSTTKRNYSDSGTFNFKPTETSLPGYATQTGNAFASFLLGAVDNASPRHRRDERWFQEPYHALWVSDDIKVTPKLTVNIGLRWEIITPFWERTDRMSYIDLGQTRSDSRQLPGLLVFKNRPTNTYWGEFGPRFGIAYQLNEKIVIRAGYAMLNTPPITNGWGYGGFLTGYNARSMWLRAAAPPGSPRTRPCT